MDFELNLNSETVDHCRPVEPLCLSPADTVRDAVARMKERNEGSVLVCRDGLLVGIFTERDALRMMAAEANFDVPLQKVMTANPVTLGARATVGKAIAMMTRGGYRRLPIVDEQGRPTGVIKVRSILHYLVEHFPAVVHNLPPEPHHFAREREGA